MSKFPPIHSCLCEHIAHSDRNERTPNGNPGHTYGARYHPTFLVNVKTPYGTFLVCKDCAKDCHR
jgi:hypothetical protein